MRIVKNPQFIKECLEKYNVYEFISDKNIELFAIRYKAGEYIRQPEVELSLRWLQFVVEGMIHIYMINADGTVVSTAYGEGHVNIGETEMLLDEDYGAYVRAITDVTVLALSMDRYRNILLNDPVFLRSTAVSHARMIRERMNSQLEKLSLEERVINTMTYHCPGKVLKGLEFYSSVFHCSVRQLQRVLNKLAEEGRVKKVGKGAYTLIC